MERPGKDLDQLVSCILEAQQVSPKGEELEALDERNLDVMGL
jgi:hypothetical protein